MAADPSDHAPVVAVVSTGPVVDEGDGAQSPDPRLSETGSDAAPVVDLTDTCVGLVIEGSVPPEIERQLLAILDAPLEVHESAHLGFARKERELGELFAAIPARESQALHVRLSRGAPGDQLAAGFARLASERRGRLIRFLSHAARREALANAGLRARSMEGTRS